MSAADPSLRSNEDFGFHKLVDNTKVSALQKYQDLAVGDRKLFTLLKYELLLSTVAFVPGAAGIVLRQYLYRFLVRQLGKGVMIGRSITLRHPAKISIGHHAMVDDYCVLNALGDESSEIILGDKVFVGRDTVLRTRGGKIVIHDYADIGRSCYVGTTGEHVNIGQYVLIAAHCCIGGGQHRTTERQTPIVLQGMAMKGDLVIEDNVWIGANVTVNSGVRIGEGSIVGAGSVVTKDIPPDSVAYGVPARVMRKRT